MRTLVVVLCILFIVIVMVCFGVYYEYAEFLFQLFFSGSITQGVPANIFSYMAMIGMADIFIWLYSIFDFPWYALINYFLIAAATLWLFVPMAKRFANSGIIFPIMLLCLLALFLCETIIYLEHTRIAFLLCTSAVINHFLHSAKRSVLSAPYLLNLLLFTIGTLMRIEVGMMLAVIIAINELFTPVRIKEKVVNALLFSGITIAISLYAWLSLYNPSDYYHSLEPDLTYGLRAEEIVLPIGEMKTARDSVKWLAVVKENIFFDPEGLPVEFIRSIVPPPSVPGIIQSPKVRQEVVSLLSQYLFQLAAIAIIMIISILLLIKKNLSGTTLPAVLLPMIYIAMGMAINVMIKAEERVFYPVLALAGILSASLLLLALDKLSSEARTWKRWLVVLLAGLSLLEIIRLRERATASEKELHILRDSWNKLKEDAAGKAIVLDNRSASLLFFSTHPFQMQDVGAFSRVYLNDMGSLSIIEPYKTYLSKECGCDMDDASGFYRFLQQHPEQPRIISRKDRLDFLSQYFHTVHALDLKFEKADTNAIFSKTGLEDNSFIPLYQYRIIDPDK